MRRRRVLGLVQAPSVRLDAGGGGDAPKWLKCAYEGTFKGHWMGEFTFTRATFEQIVANFHQHPAYMAGAEQASPDDVATGLYDVVQFDFHHASEQRADTGTIGVVGAPAQAWALDVAVRDGEGGKAELWSLTRYLEPAKTYVNEGRYKWLSVAVTFNGTDPVTGRLIGAVLTSVAFTNQPFLQALPAIAASIYRDKWAQVTSADSLIARLREEFELEPTDTTDVLRAKVDELKAWAQPSAAVPEGVDVDYAVSTLRQILNLPTLATSDEVFAEIDKLLPRPTGATTAPTVGAPTEITPMPTEQTTTASAQTQGKSPAEHLRDSIAATIAGRLKVDASTITDTKILLATEQGGNAMEDLAAMLESLGASNVREALAKVAEAQTITDKFKALMPAYEAMKAKVDGYETAAVEDDVGMAMATLGFNPKDTAKANLCLSLTRDRKSDADQFRKDWKLEEARQAARLAAASADQAAAAQRQFAAGATGGVDLTQSLATQRQHHDPFAGVRLTSAGPVLKPTTEDKPGAHRVDLSAVAGRNDVEKAMNYLKSQPGGDKLTHEDLHASACALARTNRSAA